MPEEFDDYIERKLPIKLQLAQKASTLARQKIMEAEQIAARSRMGDRFDVGYMIFLEDQLQNVALSGIGSDQLKFNSIALERFDEDDSPRASLDDYDAAVVRVYLYNDGSPYVLDGDVLEPNAQEKRRLGGNNPQENINEYNIILAAEFPPVIVQFAQMDFLVTEDWEAAIKHELSDDDCRSLMAALDLMTVNADSVLWTTEFYHDTDEPQEQ